MTVHIDRRSCLGCRHSGRSSDQDARPFAPPIPKKYVGRCSWPRACRHSRSIFPAPAQMNAQRWLLIQEAMNGRLFGGTLRSIRCLGLYSTLRKDDATIGRRIVQVEQMRRLSSPLLEPIEGKLPHVSRMIVACHGSVGTHKSSAPRTSSPPAIYCPAPCSSTSEAPSERPPH